MLYHIVGYWEHLAQLPGNLPPPSSAILLLDLKNARNGAIHTHWCFWAPLARPHGSGAAVWCRTPYDGGI